MVHRHPNKLGTVVKYRQFECINYYSDVLIEIDINGWNIARILKWAFFQSLDHVRLDLVLPFLTTLQQLVLALFLYCFFSFVKSITAVGLN